MPPTRKRAETRNGTSCCGTTDGPGGTTASAAILSVVPTRQPLDHRRPSAVDSPASPRRLWDVPMDPVGTAELVTTVRNGDVDGVQRILTTAPEIVNGPLGGPFGSRWALHITTDWPGYFPHGPDIVRLLLVAGADPDGRSPGDETPLHWAASSDDEDVAAALIDGGADLEAADGSIGTHSTTRSATRVG